MAERLAPDNIIQAFNLTGTIGNITDDPDSPDGSWMTASSVADVALDVGFPLTTGTPIVGVTKQEFRVLVRPSGAGTPKAILQLWEDGSLVSSRSDVSVSGQMVISYYWDYSVITDPTNVEMRIIGLASGATTLDIGAVEWNAHVYTSSPWVKTGMATVSCAGGFTRTGAIAAAGSANAALLAGALRPSGMSLQADASLQGQAGRNRTSDYAAGASGDTILVGGVLRKSELDLMGEALVAADNQRLRAVGMVSVGTGLLVGEGDAVAQNDVIMTAAGTATLSLTGIRLRTFSVQQGADAQVEARGSVLVSGASSFSAQGSTSLQGAAYRGVGTDLSGEANGQLAAGASRGGSFAAAAGIEATGRCGRFRGAVFSPGATANLVGSGNRLRIGRVAALSDLISTMVAGRQKSAATVMLASAGGIAVPTRWRLSQFVAASYAGVTGLGAIALRTPSRRTLLVCADDRGVEA